MRSADAPRLGVGDFVVGRWRYLLLECIGEGGFGAVFRARCLPGGPEGRPPDTVAIKVLDPATARAELSALRAVRSPHVVHVYDGAVAPTPFLALHLHTEGTLRARLIYGAMEEPEVWRLLRDLLTGLAAVHAASLLHLDVKPANIFAGDDGWVLGDFGLAWPSRATLPVLGLGTVGYQAPEQRDRQFDRLDMRTDLFGVGATSWAAWARIDLARKVAAPFREVPPGAQIALRRPSAIRPGCSTALDDVISRLVALDPKDRPASAAEALALLPRDAGVAPPMPLPGVRVPPDEAAAILDALIDPLLAAPEVASPHIRRVGPGELLCQQGDPSHAVFVLLRGAVRVERDGELLRVEDREGTFLGEVAALTGAPRTADVRAVDTVWVRVLDATQLEERLVREPALALRLVRSMAARLAGG